LNKYNSGAVYIMSDGSVVTTGAIIYKESENKFYMDNKHYE